MQTLREGSQGPEVEAWQNFLIGQGFDVGVADGDFGPRTKRATIAFQEAHGLVGDGVAGNRSFGEAARLGFQVAEEVEADPADPDPRGINWPPPPADLAPISGTAARQAAFGRFAFESDPSPDNPERIAITDGWDRDNIARIEIPQLAGISGAPASTGIWFFRAAHPQLQALWQAWENEGLLDRVVNWAGSYVPRFIRGSRTSLSNHAFGTAFDINTRQNGLGAIPAAVGKQGSVRELVPLANAHGFYWGGHFRNRPDGMHFEIAELR
jgi:peptidoglycan hydrolase-like protein with peptidoglycan-binding domain